MEFDLSLIGFNRYEMQTYNALLSLGKSTATKISQKSDVPQGKIYHILYSLARKGLIDIIPKEPKEFILNNPENLMKIAQKSKEDIEKIQIKVEEMKNAYEKNKKTDESKVLVREGRKSFYSVVENLREPKKYEYVLKWRCIYNKNWAKKDKGLLLKNVDLKVLTRVDEETTKDINKWLKVHKNIRKVENDGAVLDIIDDEEVLIGIIECNSNILIRDRAFAKLMKNMFLKTYNNSQNIK